MQPRRLLRIISVLILGVAVLAGACFFVPPLSASAHSFVIGSDPIDGSTIEKVPTVAHIYFNADLSPLSRARVYSIQNNTLVDITEGESSISSTNPRQLNIPVQAPEKQPKGSYEILWTAVANGDGHTTNGIIGFNVGFSSTGVTGTVVVGPESSNNLYGTDGSRVFTPTALLGIVWDWLMLLGLALWIGIVITEHLILQPRQALHDLLERVREKSTSFQWLCLFLLLFSELVSFLLRLIQMTQQLQTGITANTSLGLLLQSNYGRFLIAQLLLTLCTMGFLYWTHKNTVTAPVVRPKKAASNPGGMRSTTSEPRHGALKTPSQPGLKPSGNEPDKAALNHPQARMLSWQTIFWLVLIGLFLLAYVLSSDAVQVLRPHFSVIIFEWLFLAALCVWLGGLAYLGLILLPNIDSDHQQLLNTVQRCMAPYHKACIGIFLVSGIFLAETAIPGMQELFGDPYGRTLLVEALLFLLLLASGAYALYQVLPKMARQARLVPVVKAELPAKKARQSALQNTERTLRQTIYTQIILGGSMFLCLALLTFYAPPIVFPANQPGTAVSPSGSNATGPITQQVGDLSVTLQVLPGKVNATNSIVLALNDANGAAVTDAQIQLQLNMIAMDMGTTRASVKSGNPLYVAVFEKGTTFDMSGVWAITVHIQRPGQQPLQTTFQVTLP
ncbi:YtkA-like protein [Thermosporothrix hazakensis]|uniref:YtkA-like protein n=1 Tax=Thermosporothrix hazakensis TaxID=644383 RepID=A0A326U0B0_THEHA|nr:copper resistance protein CopC [Thermosporothrix hazakensis]PZW22554.1 YtkA-like protein [Thermosporothrix hazakensis]GCE48527.1 hypothetical protein KTH_33960 [Thermosporothrix hazakensis]